MDNNWRRAHKRLMAFRGRVGTSKLPKTEIEEPSPSDGQLKVEKVDLLLAKNRQSHRTENYENTGLVLRRGQSFDIEITLAQVYDEAAKHQITLELWWGTEALDSHNAHVVIPIRSSSVAIDNLGTWAAKFVNMKENKVTVQILSPADGLVGRYQIDVTTKVDGKNDYRFIMEGHVYLLFNPWCEADDVFMHNEIQRKEYVLNDMGMYFYGAGNQVGHAPWYFGQFEVGILECVVTLMEAANKRPSAYSSPIEISRLLSALVNAPDDNGILVGNWSGNYEGGTEPTAWSGSASIFEEFIRTGQPVCYGQCWVFGGLLSTALRTIGIPGRTITNFNSAHDADANCLLDYHFDADGNPLDNDDSVWNFHVWNDAWMARPDLPKGYGGWQAVDSTPQELSDYVFRTGPSSLTAIKNGHVYLNYDTKFVFAEVNACKVSWKLSADLAEAPKLIQIDTKAVGTRVVTKAVGKSEMEDITNQYKQKEGSVYEYLSLFAADKYVDGLKKLLPDVVNDTAIELVLPPKTLIGDDMIVKAKLSKTCPVGTTRNAHVSVTCNSVYYTGVKAKTIFQTTDTVEIKAKEEVLEWQIKAADYLPLLVDQANMRFYVSMYESETNNTVTEGINYRLIKPDLVVQVPTSAPVGQFFSATVTFTNPLDIMLQDCFFHTEGPAVLIHKKETFRNIKPKETVIYTVRVIAKKPPGKKDIIVSFSSVDLIGVSGKATVNLV
ncbi:protein-glutamine gamma-glutamyltransferase K-like [Asterias rubens]|uniref:protein-glutamine gamma-glutamyltransferase K-like n=1 Tax=Asterias rubens TaxID=7604 RepID=UPI00145573F6|nr:protein-glutamine gamma-glutamyltransferase K-like [Asterias rubens]